MAIYSVRAITRRVEEQVYGSGIGTQRQQKGARTTLVKSGADGGTSAPQKRRPPRRLPAGPSEEARHQDREMPAQAER